ncbi:MAG TPA: non-homologous end-joining DNA ligase [Verrucomicrobiae bacterium]|nr:non-homologous end-joining DNA ligase [Verrucomicrobiae bacterium]
MAPKTTASLRVNGRDVRVSSLEKVLFPGTGFSKAEVITYYIRIGEYLLPHLRDRPLTLKLFPDGVEARAVYRHNAPSYTPGWIARTTMPRSKGAGEIHSILANDLPTLVWLANAADIEMHPLLARAPKFDEPTMMVFDLDPGPPAGVLECAEVALWLREILLGLRLESFVKVSGSKGLHLLVPLNARVTYEQTQARARWVAELMERARPEKIVAEMAKASRGGKVFIDYSQNARHKSTAAVYSLRARPEGPFVSMPLTWESLKKLLKRGEPEAFRVRPDEAVKFAARAGDIFAPVVQLKQKLPSGEPDPGTVLKAARFK